jgi:Skp family chaperone for outer membrane proteins
MSADQLARKQAIEKAVGSGSSTGALVPNAVAAQTVPRLGFVNSGRPIDTSAYVQPNGTSEPAAVNPGEAARLQAELEALRRKLRETELKAEEQVLAFKREAQKRHGEAVYVRTQLDEVSFGRVHSSLGQPR